MLHDSAHPVNVTLSGAPTSRDREQEGETNGRGKKMMNSGGDEAANVDTMPRSTMGAHFRIRDYVTSLPGIIRVSLVVRK